MVDTTFDIRDIRAGGWHWADNAVVRRDGRTLGVYGVAVYSSLCAHAPAGGPETAPLSANEIAHELDCSRSAVVRSLKQLAGMGWIRIQGGSKGGRNTYFLLPRPNNAEPIVQNDQPAAPVEPVSHTRSFKNNAGVEIASLQYTPTLNPVWSVRLFSPGKEGEIKFVEGVGATRRAAFQAARQELAARQKSMAGTIYAPPPEPKPAYEVPDLLSVPEIAALKLTRAQWAILKEREQAGKKRRSVIKHCESKINAHPLEPFFNDMMEAVDACTVQSMADPGMGSAFAAVIRTKLWASKEKGVYYTPDELLQFSRENPKVDNVHWLPGKLSTWRQQRKGQPSDDQDDSGTDKPVSGTALSELQDVFRRLGRDPNDAKNYLPQVQ